MREIQVPLPKAFSMIGEYVLNTNFQEIFNQEELDLERLEKLVKEVKEGSFEIDKEMVSYETSKKINVLMDRLSENPKNNSLMEKNSAILSMESDLDLNLNLWKAQNSYFSIGKELYEEMSKKAKEGNEDAKTWIKNFNELGKQLNVKIQ
ncbi:hypothetical protein AKJ49_02215 [candidate division MSBL1 archaeon SCGC-AAA382A03]|uniref:Uncharacterized protein n=1 Tax=candidate division MSBL1 archaeon SCGC-AAA382A03 TaxID=1698278 RepID=A0A133VD58_9EURY|nr:hypothetical protein AKJ49_02215 [candidate division MSBL1 archaeon SCGC-AAA382A03]